jgi:hypothetical protein
VRFPLTAEGDFLLLSPRRRLGDSPT